MKKIGSYLILLVIVLLPLKANALTGSLQIACSPTSINEGESSSCTITGSSDGSVTAVDISVSVSANLELVSFTPVDFEGSDINNNKIESYSKNGVELTGNFTVGKIVVKAKSGATAGSESIKLSSIIIYEEDDGYTFGDVQANVTITKPSTLRSLEVTGGKITTEGGFKPEVKDYNILLDSTTTSFSINATATNSTDTITFYKGCEVKESNKTNGDNIKFDPNGQPNMCISILVGESTTYNLLIGKDVSGSDNTLATLTVGGVSVPLSSCTKAANDSMNCSVTIPASPIGYTVSATLTDSKNFKIDATDGGVGNYNSGPESFFIKVIPIDTSSGLSSLTYFITVNRSAGSSSNPIVDENPQTGNILSFIVAVVLIFSFVVSIILYKKNIDGYQH